MRKWKILNQQYNANLFPYAYHIQATGAFFAKTCGRTAAVDHFVELRNNGELTQGIHWQDYHKAGKYILSHLEDKVYSQKVLQNTTIFLDRFYDFSKKVINLDLNKQTDGNLNNLIIDFRDLFLKLASWGVLISFVEYEHQLLSKKVKLLLKSKVNELKLGIGTEELFQILSTNNKKTYLVKERDELLLIAKKIVKNKKWDEFFKNDFSQISRDLDNYIGLKEILFKHWDKYKWLSFGFEGPLLSLEDIIQSTIELVRKDPFDLEVDIRKNQKDFSKIQKFWEKELLLNKYEMHLVWLIRELGFSKAIRKDVEYCGNYSYHLLLTEIGKRNYLSAHQAHYLSIEELSEILLNKKEVDYNLVNKRIKLSVYACENLKVKLFAGDEAQKYRDNLEKLVIDKNLKVLIGECACPGKVRGVVKVVLDQKDYGKFYAHDILVSYATNPNMMPLMKISKAIITDVGGITCHAAIVSRELNIPCVIGTKIGTQILKDGDEVEVDANKGLVNIISEAN
ncbi:MAG: Phosphoenolpyruvate synthase/pyruvate phosphate dikinase [Candidatus Magasanikbacteria bacterium GW2011_GWC2_37_14]|uniref:Phosphoenolpyruvate synthase/pyruvate phosphate dikinase n=1 Tax=Candidatus Magasanikbacteria bacterium GW2011_GWC2_37_14 TaxID=1619046 RepID=A0A0G0GDX8_9BACT|nr:MAG: Phosphoenolpyruvate synthase/pyruvate phosphate dikinase [Candidatus Magasanikbacteria bacterium GW2011_GWC2_37_14]